MTFPCSSCGLCCKRIGTIIKDAQAAVASGDRTPMTLEVAAFPYSYDSSGACEKLVDNQCTVYENRPDVCNIEKNWKKHYAELIPQENYYSIAAASCKLLQEAEKQNDDTHKIKTK